MLNKQAVYKFLSQLSKREKTVLYVTAFFVTLMFLDRLVVYPIYSRVRQLNGEIKQKESDINKYLRLLLQKERILNERKKYAAYLDSRQPEEQDMTSILKEIENLANKSSLYVVDMKPGGVRENSDQTRRYLVNLNCEGEMEQIADFMYNVENSNVLLMIERYQISPKSKESRVATCTMTISKIIMP